MKLNNGIIELHLEAKGGEMSALYALENNTQFLWQGSAEFWSGKNPTLFPIVGNTFSKSYEAKGSTYHFLNHGFIRTSTLTCIEESEKRVCFELHSNDDTRSVYPYEFDYNIAYTLNNNSVHVAYDIKNEDDEEMPFGFGIHPGFRCPIEDGESFEDYTLVFEVEEELEQLHFAHVDKPEYEKVKLKEIPLSYDYLLYEETLIYKGMKSKYVTLKGPKHEVKVSLEGFEFLAFWTIAKDAPYICIEPWCSHGDFEEVNVPFKDRIGMKVLQPQEVFHIEYTINVK